MLLEESSLLAFAGGLWRAGLPECRRRQLGAPERRGDPERVGRQPVSKTGKQCIVAAIAIMIVLPIDAPVMADHRRVADPPPACRVHRVATRESRMARRAMTSIAPSTSPVMPPSKRRASGASSKARQAAPAA